LGENVWCKIVFFSRFRDTLLRYYWKESFYFFVLCFCLYWILTLIFFNPVSCMIKAQPFIKNAKNADLAKCNKNEQFSNDSKQGATKFFSLQTCSARWVYVLMHWFGCHQMSAVGVCFSVGIGVSIGVDVIWNKWENLRLRLSKKNY